jgi:hypothetical protein
VLIRTSASNSSSSPSGRSWDPSCCRRRCVHACPAGPAIVGGGADVAVVRENLLRSFGIRQRTVGRVPRRRALLVANHVSWLDALVLLASAPVPAPSQGRGRGLAPDQAADHGGGRGVHRSLAAAAVAGDALAAIDNFTPFWEFVSGPANAGGFRPNSLDPTFGPQAVFVHANITPLDGYQHFGEVDIDVETRAMTVRLRDLDGVVLWSTTLLAP